MLKAQLSALEMQGNAGSALLQLRRLLPHGNVGRHINGYIFYHHKDAVMWQQSFRQYLFDTQPRVLLFDYVSSERYFWTMGLKAIIISLNYLASMALNRM